jgi:beta-phosphoglucomutase-like phosphatase (HAD superfamily)
MSAKSAPIAPAAPETKEHAPANFLVLIELDHLVGQTRRASFEVLKNILGEKGISLSPVQFSRFCLAAKPEFFMEALQEAVGAKKLSTRKLVEDVTAGIQLHLASSALSLSPGLRKLLDRTREKGGRVVALTVLPETIRNNLMSRLGLADLGVSLCAFDQVDAHWPRADSWLKLVKENNLSPIKAVAIATSAHACRSALTAGCRVVVVPDEFTVFQDFGGARMIADTLEDLKADEVLELVNA